MRRLKNKNVTMRVGEIIIIAVKRIPINNFFWGRTTITFDLNVYKNDLKIIPHVGIFVIESVILIFNCLYTYICIHSFRWYLITILYLKNKIHWNIIERKKKNNQDLCQEQYSYINIIFIDKSNSINSRLTS